MWAPPRDQAQPLPGRNAVVPSPLPEEIRLDRSTDKSLWDRVCSLFGGRSGDSIEQAVMEARDEGELDLAEGSMILSILRLDDV